MSPKNSALKGLFIILLLMPCAKRANILYFVMRCRVYFNQISVLVFGRVNLCIITDSLHCACFLLYFWLLSEIFLGKIKIVEKVKKSIFAFAVFFSNFTDLNIVFFYFILLVVVVPILSNLMCLVFNFLCFISMFG